MPVFVHADECRDYLNTEGVTCRLRRFQTITPVRCGNGFTSDVGSQRLACVVCEPVRSLVGSSSLLKLDYDGTQFSDNDY